MQAVPDTMQAVLDLSDLLSLPYLLDKFVFALLLVAAGMLMRFFLNRDQAMLAYYRALDEQRVRHITEVWAALYELKSRFDELRKIDQSAITTLDAMQDDAKTSAKQLKWVTGKYRFWLGESEYESVMVLHDLMTQSIVRLGHPDVEQHANDINERLATIDECLFLPSGGRKRRKRAARSAKLYAVRR